MKLIGNLLDIDFKDKMKIEFFNDDIGICSGDR
jgi:hypothetical protein